MRSEFEKWCLENDHDQYMLGLEDAYMAGCSSQQSKVDELTKQRDSFIKAYDIEMGKSIELQKRVEDLELNIKGAVTFVDLQIEATEQGREAAIGAQAKNLWSSKLLMLRPIRRVLEQAKGGVAE